MPITNDVISGRYMSEGETQDYDYDNEIQLRKDGSCTCIGGGSQRLDYIYHGTYGIENDRITLTFDQSEDPRSSRRNPIDPVPLESSIVLTARFAVETGEFILPNCFRRPIKYNKKLTLVFDQGVPEELERIYNELCPDSTEIANELEFEYYWEWLHANMKTCLTWYQRQPQTEEQVDH